MHRLGLWEPLDLVTAPLPPINPPWNGVAGTHVLKYLLCF